MRLLARFVSIQNTQSDGKGVRRQFSREGVATHQAEVYIELYNTSNNILELNKKYKPGQGSKKIDCGKGGGEGEVHC